MYFNRINKKKLKKYRIDYLLTKQVIFLVVFTRFTIN